MRTHVFSCPSSCLFFNTCLALLCPETELKKTFIPGAPQAKIKKQSPIHVFFCRSGIQTKIALFIHSVMSVYGKIISEVIKIISNVHSLLACPGLGCYFWRLINNLTQPVGRTGWDDFSSLSPPSTSSGLAYHFLRLLNSLWMLRYHILVADSAMSPVYNSTTCLESGLRFPGRLPRVLPRGWKILSGMECGRI